MGRIILKLPTPDGPRYLDYSTLIDAPTTWGMELEEFTKYYRFQYGESGMYDFPERMQRVELTGNSSRGPSTFDSIIATNRAGFDESCLTLEQLIDWYCIRNSAEARRPMEGEIP